MRIAGWPISIWIGIWCVALNVSATSLLIGIAGGTGSGKAVLAKHVADLFPDDVVVVNQNSYYNRQ